jgi:hypothetical protein
MFSTYTTKEKKIEELWGNKTENDNASLNTLTSAISTSEIIVV